MADDKINEQSQYPFDTDHLNKGDIVSTETIERAYSVESGTTEFGLVLLRAKSFLIRRFADRGEIITVRADHDTLVIETDETQYPYNRGMFKARLRGAARTHRRMLGADRSKIYDQSILNAHDRALEVQGRQLQAVRHEAMAAPAVIATRQTPVALFEPEPQLPSTARPVQRQTPNRRR